uniref:Retroelement n=2 Tax=Oryza sativa subsp. japonica TaxID=39947 RepID=Q7G534_ORYSJ|nr:Putative retroelement [Oryza sativa Japonica Group]AAP52301.1 retrotransposon protein, putative, Ty3-gypsy subclass [Oryza sativa Japonica Group]
MGSKMAGHSPNHRGEGMIDFVAELARMTLVVGYPNAPEYTTVPPLSGELPHRVRLEVHGYVGTCLANMVVEASGGTADHACQEAAYLMMARLRERHNYIFHDTAYRFHPRRASGDDVSTFRPTAGENDTTFGHMCAVMRGLDRMHSDLHKATKALNDGKLMRIVALKDEIARLKRENAQLKGLPAPGGDVDLNVNIVVCVPRPVLDGDFNAHSAWNSIREFLGVAPNLYKNPCLHLFYLNLAYILVPTIPILCKYRNRDIKRR